MGHSLLFYGTSAVELHALVPVRRVVDVCSHGAFALIGFMLRQFEIALIGIRPYNALAFSAQSPYFSVLNVPAGTIFLVLRPHSGSGNLLLFFKASITGHSTFHMMGFVGGALLCAIHGATVENTLFEDGDASNTFRASTASGRNLLDGPTASGHRFLDRFQQALAALLLLFVPVTGLWMSAVGVVGFPA